MLNLFDGLEEEEVQIEQFDRVWGDVYTLSELVFLCRLSKRHSPVFQFGTFRGITAYNFALNTEGLVYTIDIGSGKVADADCNIRERGYDSYVPGDVLRDAPIEIQRKVVMLYGDSTKVDLSSFYGEMGLVFVDGGHSYDVCKHDSEEAKKMVRPGGVIVWDDVGSVWPGVLRAVKEFDGDVYKIPAANTAVCIM